MKKMFLALGLLLASTGAQAQIGLAPDGYVFREKEFSRDTVDLRVVIVRNQKELSAKARELNAPVQVDKEAKAFAMFYLENNQCTVYMIDPEKDYAPEYLGHQVHHCLFGRWHK